jgi:hypothetical protein
MPTGQQHYFRAIAHLLVSYATYSPAMRALTISLPFAEFVFNTHMHLASNFFPSFQCMVKEGAQRWLWHFAVDRQSNIDMLVIHPEWLVLQRAAQNAR